MGAANVGSLASSALPITNLLQKRSFQFVLALIALYYLVIGLSEFAKSYYVTYTFKHARFINLEARSGASGNRLRVDSLGHYIQEMQTR